ncbi:tRNA pseudouridine(55) synthase TruB [Candidatus Peregrinibacteria bacterium]|nr:tRNA pseudouridine(55) synthase TruB [Candidatus Peregrinibacteria bacterium]
MNGFLLINKPKGVPSFKCVSVVRKLCNLKKVGFAGTLDPLASGLMILAIGEATKLIYMLDGLDKQYEVVVRLGASSTTFDGEGDIFETENCAVPSLKVVKDLISAKFMGERQQMPPKYSAVQINGKRAYQMARAGDEVLLMPRKVFFRNVEILDYNYPRLVLRVDCSKGTYIRSLANDLGAELGCGGFVEDLTRTKIGEYSLGRAMKLDNLRAENIEQNIYTADRFLADKSKIVVDEKLYKKLAQGGFVEMEGVETDDLALFENNVVGVLEKKGDLVKFKRKIN